MVLVLQLLTFVLVLMSFALVVGVPVTLATPGQWERFRGLIFLASAAWAALVVLVGLIDTLVV